MQLQVLNLDNSLLEQDQLLEAYRPEIVDLRHWGPKIRLGCSFSAFREFEGELARILPRETEPVLRFIGSGDFHHVTLALTRRLREPTVLLILDHHPDWMVGFPFLHCGTWVHHAIRSPYIDQVIHLGGETDFDNGFRWLAPRDALLGGKIKVVPGRREFEGGLWSRLPQERLIDPVQNRLTEARLTKLLESLAPVIQNRAVYVTFDKDVLRQEEAVVNWDSGVLRLDDSLRILTGVFEHCKARLVGMDIIGDWSPVKVSGTFRHLLDWLEHPSDKISADHARQVNEATNLCLADFMRNVSRFSLWENRQNCRTAS